MRRTGWLTLVLMLAGSMGCSGGVKCVPVSGSVRLNDKAPEGVLVTLVPVGGKDDPTSRPSGLVGPDGTYTLTTYDPANRTSVNGAPPGRYKVVLSWFPGRRPGEPSDPSGRQSGDKLGGRYVDPDRSAFEVTVRDEPTELAPIRVSDPGLRAKTNGAF